MAGFRGSDLAAPKRTSDSKFAKRLAAWKHTSPTRQAYIVLVNLDPLKVKALEQAKSLAMAMLVSTSTFGSTPRAPWCGYGCF